MNAEKPSRLNQRWNTYILSSHSYGFMIEATFINMGIGRRFSLSIGDFIRHDAAVLDAFSPIAVKEDIDTSSFYNDEMTMSFIRKDGQHRLILTAPYLILPSGEKGLKADLCFKEKKENVSISVRDGIGLKLIPAMPADGVIFTNHERHDIKDGTGNLISINGKGVLQQSWESAFISGENGLALEISDGKGRLISNGCQTEYRDISISGSSIRDSEGMLDLRIETIAEKEKDERLLLRKFSISRVFALFSGTAYTSDGKSLTIDSAHGVIRNVQR